MTRQYEVIISIDSDFPIKEEEMEEQILFNKFGYINSKCLAKTRTDQQNKALHLWFTMVADMLNEAGFDMKKTMKVDIPWNDYNVKEFLWRPIQKVVIGETSTKKMSTTDIDKIYDILNRVISERVGMSLPPFPCIEEKVNKYDEYAKKFGTVTEASIRGQVGY